MGNQWNKRVTAVLCTMVGLIMLSIPVFAHHGTNISYDHQHPITVKATVTEFRFANPHAQIYFDVKDEKGNIVHWSGELTNPSNLMHAGWTKKRSEKELPGHAAYYHDGSVEGRRTCWSCAEDHQ